MSQVLLRPTPTTLTFADDFARADGDLGNGWVGAGGAISGGKLVITPSDGADAHDDGNAASDPAGNEADTTAGWTAAGVTLSSQSADVQTGSYALQVDSIDGVSDRAEYNLLNAGITTWFRFTGYAREGAGSGKWRASGLIYDPAANIGAAWGNTSFTQCVGTSGALRIWCLSHPTTIYADNISLVPLGDVVVLHRQDFRYGKITASITRASLTQAGIVLNYVDSNNYAVVYLGGKGQVYYDKFVGGTRSNIGAYSITYTAGAELVVTRHRDGTVDIDYNSASLVTSATASGHQGRWFGILSTDPSNSVGDYEWTAVGVS